MSALASVTKAGSCIDDIALKVEAGDRIDEADALRLLTHGDLNEIAYLADLRRQALVPGEAVSYVGGRNVNYTNVCYVDCKFCSFYRHRDSDEAYVLPTEEILDKVQAMVDAGGTELLMQGGLHPDLKVEWFEELLSTIKGRFPEVQLHSLTSTEIRYIAKRSKISLRETLERLKAAGLGSLPGGGAEMLPDRIRQELAPLKETGAEWLEAHELAHDLGLRSSATMMYGHHETLEERVEHLKMIRDLQDRTGGFTAFICWSFQGPGPDMEAPAATGYDYLRTAALGRIYLDNVAHHQASWVTQGPKIAQVSLGFGIDDMGSTMMEENVVSAAGTTFRLDALEIERLVREAGYEPFQRDTLYRPLHEPGTDSPARLALTS
ncbi:MAG: cyclic dehypoxanthinyl futalosine synthase [Acidobacteriota bacterium]